MLKVGDVFNGARALLNDQDAAVFTNTVLAEYFKISYEEIRQECEDNQLDITLKTSEPISIPQGVLDIGGPTGPALPIDLIEPLECWEIPAGTNDDYMQMRKLRFLPKTGIKTAYLEVWQWADQYIHFLGANGDIQVKLDYISTSFPDTTNENAILKLTNVINYLKFRTAAYASMFIGENTERAQVLNDLSTKALDTLLSIKIKTDQRNTTRRRPFMAAYKRRGMMYGR